MTKSGDALLTMSILASLLLSGCGAGGDAASVTVTSTLVPATVTSTVVSLKTSTRSVTQTDATTVTQMVPTTETATPSTAESTDQSEIVQVGQVATSGGIVLTVTSMKSAKSYTIDYNDEPPEVQAQSGGKFIIVSTKITNKTKASIDITCSFPIDAKLADTDDNNFDPVDDLYKIEGNPSCNKGIQPGFSTTMKWIFEVPSSASISVFGFKDTDMSSASPTDYPFARIEAPSGLN